MQNSDPFGAPGQINTGSDWDFDIDVKGAELPADGSYMVRVSDVQKKTSQAGNPMLEWDFKIEATGYVFKSWTSLNDNAVWKVLEYCTALGVNTQNGRLNFNRRDVIGRRVIVDVVKRTAPNGRDNLNIEKMYPAKETDTPEMFAGPKAPATENPF